MKNTRKKTSSEEAWEKGEVGASEAHTRKVPSSREKAVDEGLGLLMISIRIQKDIIDELKLLAREMGIGYQPYIRQLLVQHVRTKRKHQKMFG
jgi:uncharacterized protein (DUF4415 family)